MLESKLKTEYEKRFKKPITEQELSTEQVRFALELSNKAPINSVSSITITRTATGTVVHYYVDHYEYGQGVNLSTEDWLDFINALYKSPFTNWDEKYGKERDQVLFNDVYELDIYNSDSVKPRIYVGYNKYSPNWDIIVNMRHYIVNND